MCFYKNQELGKCFQLSCRNHIVADKVKAHWTDDQVIDAIEKAPYTCFLDVMALLDGEKNFFTEEEIGSILCISKQAVHQFIQYNMPKFREAFKELEVYTEPEIDDRPYKSPFEAREVFRISKMRQLPNMTPYITFGKGSGKGKL